MRILLVDDHSMVRSGLRLPLEGQEDFWVAGGGGGGRRCTGAGARARARRHPARPQHARPREPARDPRAARGGARERGGRHDTARRSGVRAGGPARGRERLRPQGGGGFGARGGGTRRRRRADLRQPEPRGAAGDRSGPGGDRVRRRAGSRGGAGRRFHVRGPPHRRGRGAGAGGELGVGSPFAGHRIDAVAGRGGMAVVYRATDLTLDRPVALKLLTPSLARAPVFRARFERECRLAAALDHPNVVPIFHAGTERGALYLTMRYVAGTDLRTLLAEERWLEPRRAANLGAQVGAALAAAHRRGLVHRGVTPATILIAASAGGEHACLTDFGITMERADAASLTKTGFAGGTADYMSP